MKLRFSLRTLLILVTCAAVLCWWRDRPRQIADRFIGAVEAEQYETADSLFASSDNRVIKLFMSRDERNQIHAERQPQSAGDWLSGECRIAVRMEDYKGLGASLRVDTYATAEGVAAILIVESLDGSELMPEVPERMFRE